MNDTVSHVPVMLNEVIQVFGSVSNCKIVDATFGAGGYTQRFLDHGASVFAFDRDPNAFSAAQTMHQTYSDRFSFVQAPFSMMETYIEPASVDCIVFDIGVSSMQFDTKERGFSFRRSCPWVRQGFGF